VRKFDTVTTNSQRSLASAHKNCHSTPAHHSDHNYSGADLPPTQAQTPAAQKGLPTQSAAQVNDSMYYQRICQRAFGMKQQE